MRALGTGLVVLGLALPLGGCGQDCVDVRTLSLRAAVPCLDAEPVP